jgi:hypothetical protein
MLVGGERITDSKNRWGKNWIESGDGSKQRRDKTRGKLIQFGGQLKQKQDWKQTSSKTLMYHITKHRYQ